MKKYRVGIIGSGFIGSVHVEAVRRLGLGEIVALTEKQDAKGKAEALYIPDYFDDYKKMIDTKELDMVHICTPNNTHHEMSTYALKKGVNVICEKPMCRTIEEGEDMVKVAKETGLVNAINFHNRFYPMTYEMKEKIKMGQVGDIWSVHGVYLQDWLFHDTDYNWRIDPAFSGSTRAVADIGSHWIDLAETVTGLKVVEVFADFATFHKTRKKSLDNIAFSKEKSDIYEEIKIESEDHAHILLRFENGAVGNAVISQVVAGRKNRITLNVDGSEEALFWTTDDLNNLWIGHRDSSNEILTKDPSLVSNATIKQIAYPGGHAEGFPDAFKNNFRAIYKSIEDKSSPIEYATFADGLREMKICDKIFESYHTNKWVKVDE
ncbi:MAG: Gfo/Idh/MocA family oxidoreductase [Peptostreptococcaceae bacterium]|nr:Gfo/Idh/MocA family oxidoreductase [Peptostreptococcaceae bacterium]